MELLQLLIVGQKIKTFYVLKLAYKCKGLLLLSCMIAKSGKAGKNKVFQSILTSCFCFCSPKTQNKPMAVDVGLGLPFLAANSNLAD